MHGLDPDVTSGDEGISIIVHPKCHKDYTRICTRESAASPSSQQSNEDDESEENTSKIDRFCEFVRSHVLGEEQPVSIRMLTEIYGLDKENCHLRGKVQQTLLQHFDDEPLFVTVSNNEVQVVMSKQVLSDTKQCSFLHQNQSLITKAERSSKSYQRRCSYHDSLVQSCFWLPSSK